MTSFGKLLLTVLIVVVAGGAVFFLNKKPSSPEPIAMPSSNIQPEILGNQSDLILFSIAPESSVSGLMQANGIIQGGYFFEGNIPISILDTNKNVLRITNGTATTDWMTIEPVSFNTTLDFTGLPLGPAYIQIHNDNASGLPENDKSILVPIIIQ